MITTKSGRTIFFSTLLFLSTLIPIVFPGQTAASQAGYEDTMRSTINGMYQKTVPMINGLELDPPDLTTELRTLDTYAREYVKSYQAHIPIKNKLHDLRPYHVNKRKKRLDQVNSAIDDITRLHAKYSYLANKLEYKRNKLIIVSAGKLLADYAALPDSSVAFLTDRFMACITGSVQFVPEGGLGSTTASRRLVTINKELDEAHKALHKTLYTTPANPDELFKLTRKGELQAERCQRLAYELQYKLRTKTRPDLIAVENTVEQNLNKIIRDTDRILATSPAVAQCIIKPGQVTLNQARPQQRIKVFYIYASGLEAPARPEDISFTTNDSTIVTVDKQGRLTGHKTGSTEVTAKVILNSRSCSVPVKVNFPAVPGRQATVPDVMGKDKKAAGEDIKKAGLKMSVTTAAKFNKTFPPETVVRQSPGANSPVALGSSVLVTMNPPLVPQAELIAIKVAGGSPPYHVNTQYSLTAVTAKLSQHNQYTFTWYIKGRKIGTGKSITYEFPDGGAYTVKVVMSSTDPRENNEIREQIRIEFPKDYVVDFSVSPKPAQGKTYIAGNTITFTEKCKNIPNITGYRWYINGRDIGSGTRISHQFKEKGRYDVTLGIRKGSNYDEVESTKSITIGEQSIGVFDAWVNRFKDRGGPENLSICSEYYRGGSGDWSPQCKTVSSIGPVDGYDLCTGEQSDGWNTGFLAYSKKGSDKLNFEVYHFRFNNWKGIVHYSGEIPKATNPVPDSISVSCRANAADVSWTNEDGSDCSTRIWKFKSSDFLAHSGVESPTCSKATIVPNKLKRCKKFAKRAVKQFNENSKKCNLTGPEWHGDEERHKQWCLDVSKDKADDLTAYRDNALKTCGKTWCDSYAKRAVEQNEENIRNQCRLKGRPWQSDYNNHYNWCRSVSKKSADSATRERDKDLRKCTGKREGPCKQYAEKAVEQNEINLEKDCGFCGQRWQSSFNNHFDWCLKQPQGTKNSETKAREQLLGKCDSKKDSNKKTFYEPCYNDYRLDNCLNFGTNCKKPAADRFCEEKGFTEATRWDLEKVRPTYIIDDRSLCDEEACAGFSRITCSGNRHPDNQDPVCSIKRPKSGTILQPGQYVGFSADASDPDRDKLTYSWIFEGGRPDKWESWQGSVSGVRWDTPGTYTATLTVTDKKGGACTDTVAITVQDKGGPFDCGQYADKSVMQNQENLNNNCGLIGELWHSSKSGHTNWCFNNDQSSAAWNIEAREKALNECKGAATIITKNLTCEITAPAKIAYPDAGNTVNFTGKAESPSGTRISYNWKFGEYGAEPATSTKQNPGRVKFKYGGNYTTTLTVTDGSGYTCQDTRQVLVYDSKDPREFCEGYSGISMEQNEENFKNNCGYTGEHWHNDEYSHQRWCESVSLDQARSGLTDRDEKLRECTGSTAITQPPPESQGIKHPGDKAGTADTGKDIPEKTDVPQTASGGPTCSSDPKEAYQQYIAAYNHLTHLMSQGKGDTPQTQRVYAKYKFYKDCYTGLAQNEPAAQQSDGDIVTPDYPDGKVVPAKTSDNGAGTGNDPSSGGTKTQQAIALAGNWVDKNGHKVSIAQNGQKATATAQENKGPVGWKTAPGEVTGNTVKMNFNGWNLTGDISSQGNTISWSNKSIWTRVLSSSGSAGQTAGPAGGLGTSWDVTEVYGWTGVWTRRGNSNVFDALWTLGGKREKAVLTISIQGKTVNVKRKQSAGYSYPGQECTYNGTLAADNVTITGTYGCAWASGPYSWRATIRRDSGGDTGWVSTQQPGGTSTLSCENKDNEEKGCCCFKGAHTYRFGPRPVTNVLARFDTGRRFNCKSTVKLDVDRGNGWETVKTIQANSSRGDSEVAPTDVSVPVNGTIQGFRISDGCVCCIDASNITLNAGAPDGGLGGDVINHNTNSIRVVSATYGSNCGVAKGNVTPHIARQCNGKSTCRYTVNYKIIGDPAPGCAKTYVVRYQCGNNPQVIEKYLPAEAGWGDKTVVLECAGSVFKPLVKLTGKWSVDQSNGFKGTLDLQQDSTGRLTGNAAWNGYLYGTITGKVSGDAVEFTISYPDGVKGYYKGTVTQGGTRLVNGTVKGSNGDSATWDASRGTGKSASLGATPEGASTNTGQKISASYLGCYKDQGNRDLSGFFFTDGKMTTDRCLSECRSKGFSYAGTQFSTQCFCGDSYGNHGPANNCNMACSGNSGETCGGYWANSVYQLRSQSIGNSDGNSDLYKAFKAFNQVKDLFKANSE